MARLGVLYGRLLEGLMAIACLLVLAMMLMIVADVFLICVEIVDVTKRCDTNASDRCRGRIYSVKNFN